MCFVLMLLLIYLFTVLVIKASSFFFFFNDTATTEIYTLSLHDALPILSDWALMLNWIRAVSGAVSNLPSAPTKTVLGNAVSVGAWATANAASMRTAQRMRASDFTGFLRRGQLYTDINRTREIVKVAWVV